MSLIQPLRTPLHPIQLEGYGVALLPLVPGHQFGLSEVVQAGRFWESPYNYAPLPDEMPAFIDKALAKQAQGQQLVFTITHAESKKIIGCTRYYDIKPETRYVYIGGTWLAPSHQGTFVNVASKYLMLYYAFESLGVQTVGWKVDSLNERSCIAVQKLGAVREGVLRQHQLRKEGTLRDTVHFSMTRDDWAIAKAPLLARVQAKRGLCE